MRDENNPTTTCPGCIEDNDEFDAHLILCGVRRLTTGTTTHGLRWARLGNWRIVAYAQGGYSVNRHVRGLGWCLLHDCDTIPEDVERKLCAALNIEFES